MVQFLADVLPRHDDIVVPRADDLPRLDDVVASRSLRGPARLRALAQEAP
jgi:hypothetical protein